jgi:ferredoxin
MKIKRLYLLGIGLMFTSQFLTSCHDLLEKDPTDSYSETVAWSSESSLDMYVTYLYKPLNGLSNFSSLSLTDGYTDLVKYGNGVPQTWSAHNKILLQQNTITSDNNPMSSWGLYTDIFRENVFLRDAGIYGSKFNEDFLNTRIAEIRFIRAVNYARMIRIFGGVILRDETNGVDSEGKKAVINKLACVTCKKCIDVCPVKAISIKNNKAVINPLKKNLGTFSRFIS